MRMRSTLRMCSAKGTKNSLPQVWAEPFIHIYKFRFPLLIIPNMTTAWPEDHPKITRRRPDDEAPSWIFDDFILNNLGVLAIEQLSNTLYPLP